MRTQPTKTSKFPSVFMYTCFHDYTDREAKMDFYQYMKLVGKIDDVPELRKEFIAVFDTKSKNIQMGILRLMNRQSIAALCISLSASGSTILPKAVIWLHLRAIYPSATSITPEKIKIPMAYIIALGDGKK